MSGIGLQAPRTAKMKSRKAQIARLATMVKWFKDFALRTVVLFGMLVGLVVLLGVFVYGVFWAFQIHPILGVASLLLIISALISAIFTLHQQ